VTLQCKVYHETWRVVSRYYSVTMQCNVYHETYFVTSIDQLYQGNSREKNWCRVNSTTSRYHVTALRTVFVLGRVKRECRSGQVMTNNNVIALPKRNVAWAIAR
jgi:hypothetical protein